MSTRLPMAPFNQNNLQVFQAPPPSSSPMASASNMLSPPALRHVKPEPVEVNVNANTIKREEQQPFPALQGTRKDKEHDMSKHSVRASPYASSHQRRPSTTQTPHRHGVRVGHGHPASADQQHPRSRQRYDENQAFVPAYGMTASGGRDRPTSRHETPAHPLRLGPPPPAMSRPHPPPPYPPLADWSPYPLTTPHAYPVPGQSPYHHPMSHQPQPSAEQHGDAPLALGAITPTPISRAYRTQQHTSTPSYASIASSVNTPMSMSLKTPYSTAAAQCHMSGTGDRVMLRRVDVHNLDLCDLEPAAEWISVNPPDYWLAGDGRSTACNEPYKGDPEVHNFKKKLASSRNFRSRNPWDYLVKDGRENFSEAHRMFLECVWILTATPTTNERERLGAWMGVATRRITVFYQNRRQTLATKTKGNSNVAPSRRNSVGSDDGFLAPNGQPSSTQKGGPSGLDAEQSNEEYFGYRLNDGRCVVNIDDGWKWTSEHVGAPPMPDDDLLAKLSVAYAIFKGQLDHHCYYQKYLAAAAAATARSGSTSSSSSHFSRQPSYTPPMYAIPCLPPQHRLDDIMVGNGLPTPARHRAPRVPEYVNGQIVNLTSMIPTDPPSDSPPTEPLRLADGHDQDGRPTAGSRSNRGERVPSFAMRPERSTHLARASAADIYRSSGRAKALSRQSSAGPIAGSASPFSRTESLPLPSLGTQPPIFARDGSNGSRSSMPIRGARPSLPSSTSASAIRPPLHTKPRNSFSRSQSDFGIARPSRKTASPAPTETESVATDTDMEAAELLMGMSRSTVDPTGSGSGSSSQ